MKFPVYFISLITIYNLPKSYSQGSTKVPGKASCTYFAAIQEYCNVSGVPATDLPQEAESFLYYDIRTDDNLNIVFGYSNINNDVYMQNLLDTGKPIFLYYGPDYASDWEYKLSTNAANQGETAKTEIANLKAFLDKYDKITGIIIQSTALRKNSPCFSENFKLYLDEMKKGLPEYGIGLDIFGPSIVILFSQETNPIWLDFKAIDPLIDFYVVNVNSLNNDCTDEFKLTGTTPLFGDAPTTIDTVKTSIDKLGIPKNKIYWTFSVSPSSTNPEAKSCDKTNAKLCASTSRDGFCSDTIQSYFDKGAFVKDNGAGFIGIDVDLKDDPYGCCQCEGPYPAFRAILAGFSGAPVPASCPLFDKS